MITNFYIGYLIVMLGYEDMVFHMTNEEYKEYRHGVIAAWENILP